MSAYATSPRQNGGEVTTTSRSKTAALRTTWGEDLTTVLLASWLTLGGFVDGFAHRNLDTPETFFTPWHAVLYSGFLAVAFWLAWLVIRNRPRASSLTGAIPSGYGTSVAGVVVFMAGAIGDMFWHIVFGIEVSIDALLSPTHLLLLIGALLILSGPLRAAWFDDDPPPGLRPLLPAVLAATMAAAQLGFFFQYVDGTSMRFMETPYIPGVETGYFAVVAGVGSVLITTMILMGALLLLMRRWVLPFGAGLVLFGGFGLLMELLEGFEYRQGADRPGGGGSRRRSTGPGAPTGRRSSRLAPDPGVFVPVVMWILHFGIFSVFTEINWPVSVWAGLIVFSGLAGVGLSLLAFPWPHRRADLDQPQVSYAAPCNPISAGSYHLWQFERHRARTSRGTTAHPRHVDPGAGARAGPDGTPADDLAVGVRRRHRGLGDGGRYPWRCPQDRRCRCRIGLAPPCSRGDGDPTRFRRICGDRSRR